MLANGLLDQIPAGARFRPLRIALLHRHARRTDCTARDV